MHLLAKPLGPDMPPAGAGCHRTHAVAATASPSRDAPAFVTLACKGRRLAACLIWLASAGMAAAPAWGHDCVVKDWAIAAGVAARQPYGKGNTFSAAAVEEVVAFANLDCSKVAGDAVFRFFRDDKMVLAVETPLRPGQNWRTWAAVRAQPGRYLVMLEVENMILIEDAFQVTD